MKLNERTIEEFKKIYQDEFGEKISDSQAYEKFLRLVNLMRVVLKEPFKGRGRDITGLHSFDEHLINAKLKE